MFTTTRSKITAAAVGAALLGAATGGAFAIAGGDDEDPPATGPGAERAKAAALRLLPGGTANAVERDGEDGATWEVEVTKSDGSTVDVRLDENYRLVVVESDSESPDD